MDDVDYKYRIEKLNSYVEDCTLCPHECKINRITGKKGTCKLDAELLVSSVDLHFGEERPLVGRRLGSGKGGSGTIFFAGCNLKCIFCQNYSISHYRQGVKVSVPRLAEYMLDLQNKGAYNINLVSPTSQTHKIVESIYFAKKKGLNLPIVYNCGGYESIETLRLLDGIINIYMPDIKYTSEKNSLEFSKAKDYPYIVNIAVKEMHRQVGDLVMDNKGIAKKGLLIRHLVLPNELAGTEEVLSFIAREISPNSYVNVMGQYRPMHRAFENRKINRRVSLTEIQQALEYARSLGLTRGLEQ